jgi:hypothetical protein
MEVQLLRVNNEVKLKFDKLQFNLKMIGKRKTQSEIVEMLVNFYEKNNQEERGE